MINKYSEEIIVINGIFIALLTVNFVTDLHKVGQEGYGHVYWGFTVKSSFNDVTIVSENAVDYAKYYGDDGQILKLKEYNDRKEEFSVIHQEFIKLWNEYLEKNK